MTRSGRAAIHLAAVVSLVAGLTAAAVTPALAAGTLSVTAQTEDFAAVLVNTEAQGHVEIDNTGTESVYVTNVTLSGTGSSAYTLDSSECVGTTLDVETGCRAYLTFTPTSAESYPATVTVTSDATGSPQSVDVTGSGANPLPNDDATAATTISSLPFSVTVHPFLATYSESDPHCFYSTPRSLWYVFTPSSDMNVGVTVSGDYAVAAMVTGTPASFGTPTCITYSAPQVLALSGGTTYYFMLTAFSTGSLSIEQAVPVTSVTAWVTKATVSRPGWVAVYGTVTCDTAAHGTVHLTSVTELVGRSTVTGWGESDQVECGTQPTQWVASAYSDTDVPFRPGRISVSGYFVADNKWYTEPVSSPTFAKVLTARGTKSTS